MIEPDLRTVAKRAASQPFFLAGALQDFATLQHYDDAQLAAYLGCAPDDLHRLALCRRPLDGERFVADIAHLANRFSLQPDRLANVLRASATLQALREAQGQSHSGLMAARDDESGEHDR